ncbi:transcriptional regulator QRICH1-like [Haliotis asinina]|uniref:transcriptional regulator QRICH1-like n=1 Tax=Haliotis asinina TaxID=109174 RepID=UPI0035319E32
MEVRKESGENYPPKTLRQLVLLIQMKLVNLGRNVQFLSDPVYTKLKNTLDNVMKVRASEGLGMLPRQADVITVNQEQVLWEKGIVGDSSPQTLLDTMLYLIGLNFALRSGVEHRTLTVEQLEIGENDQGEFIRYHEKVSKCNQRGLKDYHVAPKSVTAYASDVSHRCIVQLYRKYLGLRPIDAPTVLYLRPLSKPRPDRWYSVSPVGEHTLSKTVSRLCAAAGFSGFYTNHSLRATSATRLFRSGVDEQLIAKTTGHRSNAIRNYKRICTEQEATLSRIVQRKPRKRKSETATMSSSSCEKS